MRLSLLKAARTADERRKFGAYYGINAETGARVRPLAVLKVAGPPFLVRTAAEMMAGRFYNCFHHSVRGNGAILHWDGKKQFVPVRELLQRREAYYGKPRAARKARAGA